MTIKRAIIIIACFVWISTLGCGKRLTSFDGLLYYTVEEASRYRIESMDQNGDNVKVVLGALIDRDALVRESARGADEAKLENTESFARCPSLSSDGSRLVYLAGSPPAVRVYNLRSKSEEVLIGGKETFASPDYSQCMDEIVFLRRDDSIYSDIMVQLYPAAPRKVLRARRLENTAWSNLRDVVYFTNLGDDGVISFYQIKTDGTEVTKLMDNVTDCSMAPIGSELAVILEDKLQIYDTLKKTTRVVVSEAGITSPTWNPAGNTLAYVRQGVIYTVSSMGGEPLPIETEGKNILDVCWAKGL